jgi:lipid II:glycine glycyltransferase (peptidoglycan interpeptide bridge formation enzyme)
MISFHSAYPSITPGIWNTFADHPLQSWEWGEIREVTGIRVVRFVETASNTQNVIAVYQMTLHKLPLLRAFVGYIPKSKLPSPDLIKFLRSFSRKNKVIFVKCEPHVVTKGESLEQFLTQVRPSPHPLFTRWNQILDLTPSEDDLLSRMHHKTRYNIKLAIRRGVSVTIDQKPESYRIFEDLYFQTCKRQRYHGHTPLYHQAIWRKLGGSHDQRRLHAYIAIAWHSGQPLAAYELWRLKETMYYPYGGSSYDKRDMMAPNLLMWEAIRFAKAQKCVNFDFWGSLPPHFDTHHAFAGFTRFKMGYGTKFVEYLGSFDLVIAPAAYRIYSLAHFFRKKILSL